VKIYLGKQRLVTTGLAGEAARLIDDIRAPRLYDQTIVAGAQPETRNKPARELARRPRGAGGGALMSTEPRPGQGARLQCRGCDEGLLLRALSPNSGPGNRQRAHAAGWWCAGLSWRQGRGLLPTTVSSSGTSLCAFTHAPILGNKKKKKLIFFRGGLIHPPSLRISGLSRCRLGPAPAPGSAAFVDSAKPLLAAVAAAGSNRSALDSSARSAGLRWPLRFPGPFLNPQKFLGLRRSCAAPQSQRQLLGDRAGLRVCEQALGGSQANPASGRWKPPCSRKACIGVWSDQLDGLFRRAPAQLDRLALLRETGVFNRCAKNRPLDVASGSAAGRVPDGLPARPPAQLLEQAHRSPALASEQGPARPSAPTFWIVAAKDCWTDPGHLAASGVDPHTSTGSGCVPPSPPAWSGPPHELEVDPPSPAAVPSWERPLGSGMAGPY